MRFAVLLYGQQAQNASSYIGCANPQAKILSATTHDEALDFLRKYNNIVAAVLPLGCDGLQSLLACQLGEFGSELYDVIHNNNGIIVVLKDHVTVTATPQQAAEIVIGVLKELESREAPRKPGTLGYAEQGEEDPS